MVSLDARALLLGGVWLAIGMLWLCWLTRGFRQPMPELASLTAAQ